MVISGLPPVLGELGVLSYLRKNKFSPIEGVRDNVIRLKRYRKRKKERKDCHNNTCL